MLCYFLDLWGLTDPLGSIAVLSLTLTCLFNEVTILENNNNQRRVYYCSPLFLNTSPYKIYSIQYMDLQ